MQVTKAYFLTHTGKSFIPELQSIFRFESLNKIFLEVRKINDGKSGAALERLKCQHQNVYDK